MIQYNLFSWVYVKRAINLRYKKKYGIQKSYNSTSIGPDDTEVSKML